MKKLLMMTIVAAVAAGSAGCMCNGPLMRWAANHNAWLCGGGFGGGGYNQCAPQCAPVCCEPAMTSGCAPISNGCAPMSNPCCTPVTGGYAPAAVVQPTIVTQPAVTQPAATTYTP